MKAVMLNGRAMKSVEEHGGKLNGKKPFSTGGENTDCVTHLLFIAQEMGGPLNVVLGRMEYRLDRGTDSETTRSLKAIFSQARRLVKLRHQLMDKACAVPTGVESDTLVSGREVRFLDA